MYWHVTENLAASLACQSKNSWVDSFSVTVCTGLASNHLKPVPSSVSLSLSSFHFHLSLSTLPFLLFPTPPPLFTKMDCNAAFLRCSTMLFLLGLGLCHLPFTKATSFRNAYATMMYVGTPRDYEFYVAVRVLLKSLSKLNVQADLVVIASVDVPLRWIRALWVSFLFSFFFKFLNNNILIFSI